MTMGMRIILLLRIMAVQTVTMPMVHKAVTGARLMTATIPGTRRHRIVTAIDPQKNPQHRPVKIASLKVGAAVHISAADFLPSKRDYKSLVEAAEHCKGCNLYKYATQTVFGEGQVAAMSVILVGEQPGHEEDIKGHPFVGPAGRLLDQAMTEAGLPESEVYVTNAVKHFRFDRRGNRRIHKQPTIRQIKACKPWLEAEIDLLKPAAIVCLGATAAKSLLGAQFSLTRQRGEWQSAEGNSRILATYHPSAALRAPDAALRKRIYSYIVEDLTKAAALLS